MLSRLTFLASLSALTFAPPALARERPSELLEAQILLDRALHSPGVIDGKPGSNTRRAIAAFERAADLPVDGVLDQQLLQQLRSGSPGPLLQDYVIAEEDAARLTQVPAGMEGQSRLSHLGYESVVEALAEKFHMGQGLLRQLNPDTDFAVGNIIRVVSPGEDKLETAVARIEIDKQASELRAFDSDGMLVASYPATIGSDAFPSPSGSMEVRAVAAAPVYYFNPEGREWGPERKLTIAAGPNNPVGSTWIDLTRDGYGIHGSPDPRLIGKTGSHGCVRLTNWDAAELGEAVKQGASVTFL